MDTIFQIANSLAFFSWIVLIFFHPKKYVLLVLQYGIITLLAITYVFLVVPTLSEFEPDSFSTLQNVKGLFLKDEMVTAGWLHYLVFDMFVGIHIVKDAVRIGIARWKYSLCLPFTFMFGPLGLLMFYIVRLVHASSNK